MLWREWHRIWRKVTNRMERSEMTQMDNIVEEALAGQPDASVTNLDTAVSRVKELCDEIERLRGILTATRAALVAANDKVSLLDACINSNYESTMEKPS